MLASTNIIHNKIVVSAVRLLLELIDSGGPGEVTHKLIAPRLVERNTCCSPQQRTAV